MHNALQILATSLYEKKMGARRMQTRNANPKPKQYCMPFKSEHRNEHVFPLLYQKIIITKIAKRAAIKNIKKLLRGRALQHIYSQRRLPLILQ